MLIVCSVCNCLDVSGLTPSPINGVYYCSLHHPMTLKWHGQFPREQYDPSKDIVANPFPNGRADTISLGQHNAVRLSRLLRSGIRSFGVSPKKVQCRFNNCFCFSCCTRAAWRCFTRYHFFTIGQTGVTVWLLCPFIFGLLLCNHPL